MSLEFGALFTNFMYLYTASEMAAVDRYAIETIGIPAAALMETAGRAVADLALDMLGARPCSRVLILVGKGNNGGDGLVAARWLRKAGVEVELLLSQELSPGEGPAGAAFRAVQSLGIPWRVHEAGSGLAAQPDLVIDALLGVGAHGEPRGAAAELIQLANDMNCPILVVDVPSGLNASTGQVSDLCIRAQATVTFGAGKVGLYSDPGRRYAGEVTVVDIGIPDECSRAVEPSHRLLTSELISTWLPARPAYSNKGTFGPAGVVAGSTGMLGAGVLCSRAVLRSGCGLVRWFVPQGLETAANSLTPEVIVKRLRGVESGGQTGIDVTALASDLRSSRAVVLGPGIGTDAVAASMVRGLVESVESPLVVDADALTILAEDPGVLKSAGGPVILTPHPGEMGRLCRCTSEQVQADRIGAAVRFSREHGVVVVLKGSATVVAAPSGDVLLNSTGGAALSTAGTGDVLAGTIGGLLAQGLEPQQAAAVAVYLHGRAADLWSEDHGDAGLLASDLLELIPRARAELAAS